MKAVIMTLVLMFCNFWASAKLKENDEFARFADGLNRCRNRNPDSVMYYISKLRTTRQGWNFIRTRVESTVAIGFLGLGPHPDSNKIKAHDFIQLLATRGDSQLKKLAKPALLSIVALQNENDEATLLSVINEFTNTQLAADNWFENKIGRYAMAIYNTAIKNEHLRDAANQFMKRIAAKLKTDLVQINAYGLKPGISYSEKAGWLRWMYASSNYLLAGSELDRKNIADAGVHYKIAVDYGANPKLKIEPLIYYYDWIYTYKEERSFNHDYITYLKKYAGKSKVLKALTDEALLRANTCADLREYYESNFCDMGSFDNYWQKAVNHIASEAPDFTIPTIDGSFFSLASQKGKWVLIDFWGTWCQPCRQEHPQVEKFYQDVKNAYSDKISLLTIACKDNSDSVVAYINQFKYTFPVAMNAQDVQKKYNVRAFPCKILVTPQGNYVPISLDVNWVDFVKGYAGL